MKRDIWKTGTAFDMWSIPHFIYGIICAFIPLLTDLNELDSFFIMMILALLWETYEKFMNIVETVWNNIMDLLLPIASFFVGVKILEYYDLPKTELVVYLIAVVFVWAYCNLSGWLAYRRRVKEFLS